MAIEEPNEKNLMRFIKKGIRHGIKKGDVCYEEWEGHYTTDKAILGITTTCEVRLKKANKVLDINYDLLRNVCNYKHTYTRDLKGHLQPTSLSIRLV